MIVIIDSTEYKQDRTLNKRDFALIKDYGKKGLINLHIPWIIYMEVYSTIVEELSIGINQIKNDLLSLDKKGLSFDDYSTAKSAAKKIEDFLPNVESTTKKLWDDFINESNAKLHPLYEEDSTPVFGAYFTGNKPFKSLKSRKDIPDAFIFQTILKLATENIVHVVAGDGTLRDSCESEPNIKTYKSLKEFLNSIEFKALEPSYKLLLQYAAIDKSKDLLIDFKYIFEDAIKEYTSNLHYVEIDEAPLPSDNGEATILAIDVTDIIIDRDKIEFINDSFYIPILVKGLAAVDFFVPIHDYWSYKNLSGTEWNEWVYLCEDEFLIELKKTINIHKDEFNEDLEPKIEMDNFDEIRLITKFEREKTNFEL